ncbi:hypothetical protein V1512DRAFT_58479 [Lipomyces arxii]|uniref:uncharacterized protein n=1 Tax=Lipomyces arxii TaxID=56418 RepID=UPI0034CD427A
MRWFNQLSSFSLLIGLVQLVSADDTIGTDTFYTCDGINATIDVSQFSISYSKQSRNLTFDLAGQSTASQNVTATILVNAYNMDLFSYTFDPCQYDLTFLCPVPKGSFSASGSVEIPAEYASKIPSIAFSVPDLDGAAKLILNNTESQDEIGCFQSTISNGKTARLSSVTYASATVAAVALGLSTFSMATHALAGTTAAASSSVGFAEIMSWTQSMAMNGLMSVNYPTVYSSFTRNFGWASCIISWPNMQATIDRLRSHTGGNLTLSSWKTMQETTILDYGPGAYILYNGTSSDQNLRLVKRMSLDGVNFSANDTISQTSGTVRVLERVEGIARYVEHLLVPNANTFMTILLFFALILGVVIGGIFLFRAFLEVWNAVGKLPFKLEKFRQRYWTFLGSTVLRVIMVLYGTWVLYCLYQFKIGDSWVALMLAGITLGLFTLILLVFTIRIFILAHRASREGGIEELYDHKPWIRRYGLFYGQFKTKYWWFFVPILVLSFGRSAFIALADGSGMVQVVGQLALEIIFILSLMFVRPFNTRFGNVINAVISAVRIASLCCILVFVEQLGIQAETTTIVGMVLIIVQAVLTVLLALLILIQAIIQLFKKNPRRKQIDVDETELQPLGESKNMFENKDYSMSTLHLGTKESRTFNPDIGVAVTQYEPLENEPRSSPSKLLVARRTTPWDVQSIASDERVPLANEGAKSANAERTAWARGGLERDVNGRPMF